MGNLGKETILILAFLIVLIIVFMARGGRMVWYYCKSCDNRWKQKKHHGGTSPKCPNCGSTNIVR